MTQERKNVLHNWIFYAFFWMTCTFESEWRKFFNSAKFHLKSQFAMQFKENFDFRYFMLNKIFESSEIFIMQRDDNNFLSFVNSLDKKCFDVYCLLFTQFEICVKWLKIEQKKIFFSILVFWAHKNFSRSLWRFLFCLFVFSFK